MGMNLKLKGEIPIICTTLIVLLITENAEDLQTLAKKVTDNSEKMGQGKYISGTECLPFGLNHQQ